MKKKKSKLPYHFSGIETVDIEMLMEDELAEDDAHKPSPQIISYAFIPPVGDGGCGSDGGSDGGPPFC